MASGAVHIKASKRPTGQQCMCLACVERTLRDAFRDIFKGRAMRGWRTIVTLEFAPMLKMRRRLSLEIGLECKAEVSHVTISNDLKFAGVPRASWVR